MAKEVPGIPVDINDEGSSSPSTDSIKVLLLGIKLASGSGLINVETPITSTAQAIELTGEGSQVTQMVRGSRTHNSRVNLSIIAMAEPAGAPAVGSFTFGGAATTATPLVLQIEDRTVTVPVAVGDDGTAIAISAQAILTDGSFEGLHVTSGNVAALWTLTARSIGEHGNEIRIRNVSLPPGVTSVIIPMASGTGAADVAAALATIGAERYNYLGGGDTNATNITSYITWLDGRFDKTVALDGHAILAKRDTVGNLSTLGLGIDTKQITIFGDPYVPTNPWVQAAIDCAARASQTNPKASLYSDDLTPMVAPPASERLGPDDRATLLAAGIACYHYVQNNVRVNRMPTLYKTNGLGQPATIYYDVESKLTASEIRQEWIRVLQPEIGKILVDDLAATEVSITDAKLATDVARIKEILITQHDVMITTLWVSDAAAFQASLVVTKTAPDTVTWDATVKINGILYLLPGTINVTQ